MKTKEVKRAEAIARNEAYRVNMLSSLNKQKEAAIKELSQLKQGKKADPTSAVDYQEFEDSIDFLSARIKHLSSQKNTSIPKLDNRKFRLSGGKRRALIDQRSLTTMLQAYNTPMPEIDPALLTGSV